MKSLKEDVKKAKSNKRSRKGYRAYKSRKICQICSKVFYSNKLNFQCQKCIDKYSKKDVEKIDNIFIQIEKEQLTKDREKLKKLFGGSKTIERYNNE